MAETLTVEEICRRVLQKAVDEEIVIFAANNFNNTTRPMEMTSGDLVGVANLLAEMLRD
jgi:hypothetical protein